MQQGPGKSQGPQRGTGTQVKHLLPMLPGRARTGAVFTLVTERVGNNRGWDVMAGDVASAGDHTHVLMTCDS